ncbi:hypothetical protein IC762_11645 [Bradyrhizobium genosp. L]|uniref:hypothetical protein n=1 Tax=Bradyrhizobium genosp. L TaxID=83637 RepID=UPI0018A250BF|nr:hypothetical protein [Bradyrhizobium genosp. L]QPF86898.1 hypothetical protein IC762_11645 [Bradyrhizobium genosp. L]
MTLRRLVGCLVAIGVALVWLRSLGIRLPYMNQVPVFDGDAMTSEASMWARIWWDEGPFKLWFSTPFNPPSIEAPLRSLYESWPPGAFVPIYLTALVMGVPPSIPMVNWINTTEHGLIAMAAAFIAYNVGLLNRLGKVTSALLAVGVSFPILLSRGPLYVMSQIYDVTNAVLVYLAIFLVLETLYYSAQSARDKWVITALQLVTIYIAFFVDWLSYTLFAFWILSRLAAGYLGVEPRLKLRRVLTLWLIPASAFVLYLVWRFGAPGSMARTSGMRASINHLLFKIAQRMNLTNDSPITGFTHVFVGEMHTSHYNAIAFSLIMGSALATLLLVVISFRLARDQEERKAVFVTGAMLVLVSVPFYLHMIILYEHTYIHRWAMMKVMLAYGLVPFALLPIAALTAIRLAGGSNVLVRAALPVVGLAVGIVAIVNAKQITDEKWYLLGRVDPKSYQMWTDIGEKTAYQDVVVSPALEAGPMSTAIGASYKLVHPVKDFAEVDKLVERVCGDFNVVVALPEGTDPGEFGSRPPTEVIDTGRIRLLRFAHYKGKAQSCS